MATPAPTPGPTKEPYYPATLRRDGASIYVCGEGVGDKEVLLDEAVKNGFELLLTFGEPTPTPAAAPGATPSPTPPPVPWEKVVAFLSLHTEGLALSASITCVGRSTPAPTPPPKASP